MTKIKLGDLALKIKYGASSFYLSDGTVPVKIIRLTNVSENGNIDLSTAELKNIKDSARTFENLLSEGDILIAVRNNSRAALVPKEADGCCFSSDFIAITADTEKIKPELLVWYLNLQSVRKYLENKSSGGVIRSISKDSLFDIEINLPDKFVQEKLLELHEQIEIQRDLAREQEKQLVLIEEGYLLDFLGGE